MTAPIVPVSCRFCKQETQFLLARPTNLYKYDLTGQQFSRLTVNHYVEQYRGASRWCCRCECGGVACIIGIHLRRRHTQSCGCLFREGVEKRWGSHGMSKSVAYARWEGIKQRCLNPHNPAFPHYGGRGIAMCARWQHSFLAFLEDMGEPPLGMEVERKDNDGPYSPENCIWASRSVQTNNTRQNHRLTYGGETHTVSEWARLLGLPHTALQSRIQRGWDIERAFTTPVVKRS